MYQAYSGTTAVELHACVSRDANVPFCILQVRSDCQLHLERQTASLRTGDIALIRADGPVTLEPLTDAGLDAQLFQQPLPSDAVYGPNTIITSLLKTRDTAHVIFRRIAHEITNGYCDQLARLAQVTPQDALVEYEQSMLAHLLLTELSRADMNAMMIIESDFPETDLRLTPKNRQAGIILNYVMANLDTITLGSAAAHFGYEVNYFSRLCHQLFQKPFSEEVRFVRMNQGKKLLELSNQSINDIAANLGYKSPASFDRHFKTFTGLTPSAYRRQFNRVTPSGD